MSRQGMSRVSGFQFLVSCVCGSGNWSRKLETCLRINTVLTIHCYAGINISGMPQDSISIDDQPGMHPGQRVLRLDGALVMTTMFGFQAMVRADTSQALIIDFTNV